MEENTQFRTKMIAKSNSPDLEFPSPSENCLFCKQEGFKGGGVGYVICDLFRYELMQYETVQFDEYALCFRCGSVVNYVLYVKRLLLTTLFKEPLPPMFSRDLPEMSMDINENVRFILHNNMPKRNDSPNPHGRLNGTRPSPHTSIQDTYEQDNLSSSPLLLVTHSTDEEPANVGYHDYSDDGIHVRSTRSVSRRSKRAKSVPLRSTSVTRSLKSNTSPERSKSQIPRRASLANQHVCKWANCRLVCQSDKKLQKHYNEYHKVKCLLCKEYSFQSRAHLMQHREEEHQNECKICKLKFEPDIIWEHRRSAHRCKCPYCKLKFQQHKDVTRHITSVHKGRRMLELSYTKHIETETEIIPIEKHYKNTEIIVLCNNNEMQDSPIRPKSIIREYVPEKSNSILFDSILTYRQRLAQFVGKSSEALDPATSFNENIVEATFTQQDNTEICRPDSGVETEHERSLSAEVKDGVDLASVAVEVEENTQNIEQNKWDDANLPSEISNESLEANVKRINKFRMDPFVLLNSNDLNFNSLGVESSKPPSRRNKRKRLVSTTENDQISVSDTTDLAVTPAPITTIDEPSVPEKSLLQVNNNETGKETKVAKRPRKINAATLDAKEKLSKSSSPSIMNTRSRSRRQIVAVSVVTDSQNTNLTVETTTEVNGNKKIKPDEPTWQLPEEDLGEASKRKDTISTNSIDDELPYQNIRRKRVKKVVDKLEIDPPISARPDVKMIQNEKEINAHFEGTEAGTNSINPMKGSTNEDQHSFPTSIHDINTNETSHKVPALENSTNNIALELSDASASNEKALTGKIDSDLEEKNEKDEYIKNTQAVDISVVNIEHEQNPAVPEKIDIICSDKTEVNDSSNVMDNSLEDHESNDSVSPWFIHEEEYSCEEELSTETSTNDIKGETLSAKDYNTTLLNLDKIIAAVAMAKNTTSRSKSSAKKSPLRKISKNNAPIAKNVKPKKLISTPKLNKPAGKRTAVGKSAKRVDVALSVTVVESKSTKSSDNSSATRKGTLKSDDEIPAKSAKSSSAMKSVAKYMLVTTSPSTSSFKSKSADSQAVDAEDQAVPLNKKTNSNKVPNAVDDPIPSKSVVKSKIKRGARNSIQKERSHRRATTFSDFTSDIHCVPSEVPTATDFLSLESNSTQGADNRIPNSDVYAFPETDNSEVESRGQNSQIDLKIADSAGTSKRVAKLKKKTESADQTDTYGPIKKKRVKSKPRRNTAFDNAIIEASQLYLKK